VTWWDVTLELVTRGDAQVIVFQSHEPLGDQPLLSIGRSPLADVVVPGASEDIQYCVVVDNDGSAWLRDGERRVRFDRVELADTVIRLVAPPEPSALTWKLALRVAGRTTIQPAGRGADGDIRVFHKRDVIVGRDKRCDLSIQSGNLSRKHCLFRVDHRGEVLIKDLGSTNGIHLRGVRVDVAPFALSDHVFLGDYKIALAEAPKRVPV